MNNGKKCDCEHIDHFEHRDETGAHKYGEGLAEHAIKTPFQTFHICTECKNTCMSEMLNAGAITLVE